MWATPKLSGYVTDEYYVPRSTSNR